MRPPLARTLAVVALALGIGVGTSDLAQAAYPPGDVGTISATEMNCVYNPDGMFVSTDGFTVNYSVTVPEADITVFRAGGDSVFRETVMMGTGSFTYQPTGLAVFQSYSIELIAYTDSGWEVAGAGVIGCPIPDPLPDPDPDPDPDPNPDPDSNVTENTVKAQSVAAAAAAATTNTTPVTGSASWVAGAVAVALLAGGVTMVVVARRRPAAN